MRAVKNILWAIVVILCAIVRYVVPAVIIAIPTAWLIANYGVVVAATVIVKVVSAMLIAAVVGSGFTLIMIWCWEAARNVLRRHDRI